MTANQEQQAGPLALGATALDLQRWTVDELARLFKERQAEVS
jgi:hypothetical protein